MKSTLEIIPKVGVPPILLGMDYEALGRALEGEPHEEVRGEWYYFDGFVKVEFELGEVSYIEVSPSNQFDVWYQGVNVFDTPANDLVRIVSGMLPADEADMFLEPESDLRLWRPVLPSQYSPDAPEDEYRNGKYWLTIGVGNRPLSARG